jgi:hypothetical protein
VKLVAPGVGDWQLLVWILNGRESLLRLKVVAVFDIKACFEFFPFTDPD